MSPREYCIRCGDCCRAGGPALHREDLPLIESGRISRSDLVTYRAGEPVRDQVRGELAQLDHEIVKVRSAGPGWTCVFFDETLTSCAIYEIRPAECRALKCWDTSDLEAMYEAERLSRFDVVSGGAAEIAREHEARCPAARALEPAVSGGKELEEMLRYDEALRETLIQRGASMEELDFLLGRPLAAILRSLKTRP